MIFFCLLPSPLQWYFRIASEKSLVQNDHHEERKIHKIDRAVWHWFDDD